MLGARSSYKCTFLEHVTENGSGVAGQTFVSTDEQARVLLEYLEDANLGPQRNRGRGRPDPKRNLNRVEKKLVTAVQARRTVWRHPLFPNGQTANFPRSHSQGG